VKVFADTFYWIALTDSTDAAHKRARQVTDDLVTTDEVLTEYLNFFSASQEFMRREIVLTVEDILQDPGVTLIPQSRETFLAGLSLFRTRADKGYSLTDCISMRTMQRLGLTAVLTNDRHSSRKVSGRSSLKFSVLSG
jgi:predicted nucleic acid-binding protein